MRYLCLIYDDEKTMGAMPQGDVRRLHGRVLRASPRRSGRAATTSAARRCSRCSTATTVRVRNGKDLDDRRAVRRDQGAARRVLPDRGQGPERRDPGGVADPVGADRAASRCGRSWSSSQSVAETHERGRGATRRGRWWTPSTASESRRVLATLIRLLGDFDLAEEALHDAFAAALEQWPRDGVPANPRAWLVSAGRFKAIDAHAPARAVRRLAGGARRAARGRRRATPPARTTRSVEDDRLRLIFTCCHPALPPDAQVALTLREVCGLTTEEIARAFLTAPPDAGAAHRARQGQDPRRAHSLPGAGARRAAGAARRACCTSIYLVFNEGYSASSGDVADAADLSGEAIRLGRLLVELLPEPEAIGLLALMLLHESRRAARTSPDGRAGPARRPGPLAAGIASRSRRARRWSSGRSRRAAFGPYTLQAAIAAVHAEAPDRRRDRLGADRRALRRAAAGRAVAGGRAEPRRRGGDARRPRGGPGADRRDPRARRARRLPPGARGARRSVPAAGPDRRGPRLLRAGARRSTRQEPERRFLERRLRELSDERVSRG